MKVLIVSTFGLPVPAVKGGAVLTLIESIIKQNELHGRLELTVMGSYDPKAEERTKLYPNTTFHFIKEPAVLHHADGLLERGLALAGKATDIPRRIAWKTYVLRCIRREMLANDYDRVVFQNSGYLLQALKDTEVSRRYEGKVYYHLHNDIPDNISVKQVKKCRVLMISRYLLNKVNQICKTDMTERTSVVKNGFDMKQFAASISDEEKQALRAKLGIPAEKKVVIFAGRLNAKKGIAELADAIMTLQREDVVLLVVGSHNFGSGATSAFEQNLQRRFENMKDKVIFTGYVPYLEISKYYQIADVGAFPSMWEEPAGLTMLEASAAGIPVLTTVSGGIPEYLPQDMVKYVERGEGVVQRIADGITEILENPSVWSVKAANASRYVQEHYAEDCFYNSFCDALEK